MAPRTSMFKLIIPESKLIRALYDNECGGHCAMGFLREQNLALFTELREHWLDHEMDDPKACAFEAVQNANDQLDGEERREAITKAFAVLGVKAEFIL